MPKRIKRLRKQMPYKALCLIVLFSVFYGAERAFPFAAHPRTSTIKNLFLGLLSGAFGLLLLYMFSRVFILDMKTPASFFNCIYTFLFLDLTSYVGHRFFHKVPHLWRLHEPHHSEIHLEASTAFRFHVLETLISAGLRLSLISLLGFPFSAVLLFEILFQGCNLFQHANIKLPATVERYVQWIFVTPSMHRKHHDVEERLQNSNFATVFSFWDRLGGTYKENTSDMTTRFGIERVRSELSLKRIITLPFTPQHKKY